MNRQKVIFLLSLACMILSVVLCGKILYNYLTFNSRQSISESAEIVKESKDFLPGDRVRREWGGDCCLILEKLNFGDKYDYLVRLPNGRISEFYSWELEKFDK